ncbi:MAG: hypothetical protein HYV07_17195 [Deltaproteobacteria bacterium]|nr:hypothetical protein [Deltaproteobacteria bacterium]
MSDPEEVIVEFVPGTSEDNARKLVTSLGAAVRRRMRSDGGTVLLLVRLDGATKEQLARASIVARTEPNDGSYSIR